MVAQPLKPTAVESEVGTHMNVESTPQATGDLSSWEVTIGTWLKPTAVESEVGTHMNVESTPQATGDLSSWEVTIQYSS